MSTPSASRSTRGHRVVLILAGALLIAVIVNALLLHLGDPMGAVHAQARRFGHEPSDLTTVSGGYESHFLRRSAFGEFLVLEDGVESRVFIEVERPTPVHRWRLVTYRSEAVGEE